jgi:hypothetical protein
MLLGAGGTRRGRCAGLTARQYHRRRRCAAPTLAAAKMPNVLQEDHFQAVGKLGRQAEDVPDQASPLALDPDYLRLPRDAGVLAGEAGGQHRGRLGQVPAPQRPDVFEHRPGGEPAAARP